MRKVLIFLVVAFAIGISTSYAQMGSMMGEQKGDMKCGMMDGGMMPMCQQMMGQQMGHGMAMQNMMQMMKDLIKIQEKILSGMSDDDKKMVKQELFRMTERIDRMIMDMQGMMMKGMMGMPPADNKNEKKSEGGHKH